MRKNLALNNRLLIFVLVAKSVSLALFASSACDPLPSWADGEIKRGIIAFVEDVTTVGSKNYVPPAERIASIDLDGTLLCEYPVNFQRSVAIKRLRDHVEIDPKLKDIQPFKSAWEDDDKYYNQKENHSNVFLSAFQGHSQSFYHDYVKDFLENSVAPHWDRPFQELFYLPGLELVRYLEQNGFDVYICSTTEEGCIRLLLNEVLGIRHSQVIGNEVSIRVHENENQLDFIMAGEFKVPENRNEGKCLYISQHIGKAPIFAFGNSMGDFAMLKYVASAKTPSFVMILDHDDNDREILYHDEELLIEARKRGWRVASMKTDFSQVFVSKETSCALAALEGE